jgi:hypothetical protein
MGSPLLVLQRSFCLVFAFLVPLISDSISCVVALSQIHSLVCPHYYHSTVIFSHSLHSFSARDRRRYHENVPLYQSSRLGHNFRQWRLCRVAVLT